MLGQFQGFDARGRVSTSTFIILHLGIFRCLFCRSCKVIFGVGQSQDGWTVGMVGMAAGTVRMVEMVGWLGWSDGGDGWDNQNGCFHDSDPTHIDSDFTIPIQPAPCTYVRTAPATSAGAHPSLFVEILGESYVMLVDIM
jgi:hypothetical protein